MLRSLLLTTALTLTALTLTACEKTIHEARTPTPNHTSVAVAAMPSR